MFLPGKGAVRKSTNLSDKLKLNETVPGVALSNRAARKTIGKTSNDNMAVAATDAAKDPESDLTPEERAAIRRGNAPPIQDINKLKRRGSRTGAVLATGGNGSSTLG